MLKFRAEMKETEDQTAKKQFEELKEVRSKLPMREEMPEHARDVMLSAPSSSHKGPPNPREGIPYSR